MTKVDISETEWRYGFVEVWSEPMQAWVRDLYPTNIKPGESVKNLLAAREGKSNKRMYIPNL